jgi:hypothetical protein
LEVVWGTAAQPDSFADSAKTCFSALDSFRVCALAFGPTVVKNRAKAIENAKRLRRIGASAHGLINEKFK